MFSGTELEGCGGRRRRLVESIPVIMISIRRMKLAEMVLPMFTQATMIKEGQKQALSPERFGRDRNCGY